MPVFTWPVEAYAQNNEPDSAADTNGKNKARQNQRWSDGKNHKKHVARTMDGQSMVDYERVVTNEGIWGKQYTTA